MTPTLWPTLAVLLGGAIGSLARYWMALIVALRFGEGFPLATLMINVIGSFLIGMFASATLPVGPYLAGGFWRPFLMVGLCGGFTTFSSFSLQTLDLLRIAAPWWALANIVLSVGLCLISVTIGWWLGSRI